VPLGYGHVYAPGHYLDAWLEVTGIDTWPAERIQALKTRLLKKTETGDGYESRGG